MRGTLRKKFVCPSCREKVCTRVIDTKVEYYGFDRYRRCENCDAVFVTTEKIDHLSSRGKSNERG